MGSDPNFWPQFPDPNFPHFLSGLLQLDVREMQVVHEFAHKHHRRKKAGGGWQGVLRSGLPRGLHHQAAEGLLDRIHMQDGLITRRSLVQIQFPQPIKYNFLLFYNYIFTTNIMQPIFIHFYKLIFVIFLQKNCRIQIRYWQSLYLLNLLFFKKIATIKPISLLLKQIDLQS